MNQTQINEMPVTQEEEEAMDALARLGGGVALKEMFRDMGSVYAGEGKTSVMDEVHALGRTIAENTRLEAQAGTLDAPTPQHSLEQILKTIGEQFTLLSTVIQAKAQPEEAQGNSLQECVSLTLQQADWFKDLIRHELVALDIAEIAKDAVEDIVENEVESYFDNRFDPEQYYDFGDAVSDAVDDKLDDVVRERVMDSLEEVVAEKLSEANISISF